MGTEGLNYDDRWYYEREDFKDVTPIPQDDGPFPVVKIDYTEAFVDTFDYFRAILKADERSERAFELTTNSICMNPANYTVWHFRRVLLKSLNKDLNEELEYITSIVRDEPKNYQVWYHRGIIVQWMNDCSHELDFTREMLKIDGKNYHCWQHRQLVLNHFKLWEGEVEFTTVLLDKDVRNNSAWNQRYYAIKNTTGFIKETVECEVGYAVQMIKNTPNNESVFNYLKGILRATGGLTLYPALKDEFERMLYTDEVKGEFDSPYMISFLVDYYEEVLEKNGPNKETLEKVIKHCDDMATDIDIIRKEYWEYMKRTFQSKLPTE